MSSERRGGALPTEPDTDAAFRPYVPDVLLAWPRGRTWDVLDGTLVSADISGFTALSEQLATQGREGAEELSALICGCFDGMIEDCHAHGGDIVKFGGDALLVWFQGPGHERRACRAAWAMRRTIRRRRTTSTGRPVRLGVSIGVHAGAHHFFAIDVGATDLVVTGPGASATVAAESAAASGEILLTHATATRIPATWLGERRAEGVALARTAPTAWQAPAAAWTRDVAELIVPEQRPLLLAGVLPEHRQATISFLAFGGTDATIEEGGAADVAGELQRVADAVVAACDTYGVSFLATDVYGDGGKFFLSAGAPTSRGNDEDRILRAVRDIVDADPGIGLRAGINRGNVFAADLGSARRRTYTTLGDATNLAARLMSKASPGEIIVSRPTIEWASSRFEYHALDPFPVKGKSLPIHAGRLGRVLGPRTDIEGADPPLVGRVDELAALKAAAARADAGHSQVVVVTGDSGIGKTRLAMEALRQRHGRTAVARCQPFDRLSAWSVTRPLLRTLLGIDHDASASVAGAVLTARVADTAPGVVPFVPLLAAAIGAAVPPTAAADAIVPEFRRDRTVRLVREALRAWITEPTTVLVDDVQLADDASRDLVELLARDPLDAPLLVIATSGPDDALAAERVVLEPLAEHDVLAVVDELLGDRAIAPATVRSVVERAGGNPLFAGELVRALADDPDADTPGTLEALVAARVDTLDPEDRRLLRTSAVVGAVVDTTLLAEMVDPLLLQRPDRWDRLDRFLERVGPGVVRFRFDTYHRVVYGGLAFRARRALHQRLLEVLESRGATTSRDELALLAYHAERATDRARTWRYATAAARAAADAAMFDEAARLFTMALAAVPGDADPDERRAVAERAGDVYEIVGQLADADRVLSLAQRQTDHPVAVARLWRKRAEVAERMGDLRRATVHLQRAEGSLAALPWTTALRERARIESARSVVAIRQSRFEAAWEHATSALSRAQLLEDWPTAAHAALMVDNLATNLRWEGVEIERPDVAGLYRLAGDPLGEAKYLSNRATDLYFDGDWPGALTLYRTAASMSATHGHAVSEATCLNNIAEILSDQGHYTEAATLFRDAGRSWRSVGYGIGLALLDANRGRLASRTGSFDDAERHLEAAERAFEQLGAASYVTEVKLRRIENTMLAGRTPPDDRWPGAADLDVEITLRLYADRLRACTHENAATSAELLARTAERAIGAGVPFEAALAWHALAAITGDEDARRRAAEVFARLEVVVAPPAPVTARHR